MTPASAPEDEPSEEPPAEDRPEICVLLVEGRAGTASVVRTLLGASAAARFDVLRTATIDAGVDAVSFGGIDVVVLGAEVLAEDPSLDGVLRGAAGLPIIALTNSDDPRMATALIDAGLHDCVPAARISADALGWAVLRAVHRHRASPRAPAPETSAGAAEGSATGAPARAPAGLAPSIVTDAQTPVTALVGLVELLTSAWDTLEDGQKRATLSRIGTYAASVERLTADLLTIASLHADVSRPVPRHVALAPAVLEAVSTDAMDDVTVRIDPDVAVWMDPAHLSQILNALLAHAAQRASSPLVVSATTRGSSVRISMAGAGAQHRDPLGGWSLLQADSQGVGPDEGVGLAVARALAEANGGVAGRDDATAGAVWARFPSSPPDQHLP